MHRIFDMNIENLKPKLLKNEAQKLILERGVSLNRWKNFAARCQANVHMARSVLYIHDNKCALCNKTSKNKLQIHHIDYAHACIYDDAKPDCGSCRSKSPEVFQACAAKLVPVHGFCHLEIHKDELDDKALKSLESKPKMRQEKSRGTLNRELMKRSVQTIYNRIYNDALGREGFIDYLLKNGFTLKRQTSHSFTLYNDRKQRAQLKWTELVANKYL